MITSDRPTGWIEAPLGEVVEILDSRRVPVNREQRASRHGDIPYYGATGRVGWIDEPLFDEELLLLGEDGVQFLDAAKPKAYMISGPSWVNNHAHVLRAIEGVTTNKFLMHYLNWFDFHGFVTGTTRLKLNQGSMKSMPIKMPSIDEQRRIVEAVETHLSHLDAGVESLELVKRNVERIRLAILSYELDGLPKGRLSEYLREPLRNGKSAKRSEDGRVRVLTLSAVTYGDFSEKNTKLVDVPESQITDLWLEPEDLLIERSNTPDLVGTARLYKGPSKWAIFPDLLIRVRTTSEMSARFAELALQAPVARTYFKQRAKGIAGTMPKIDQTTVMEAPVPSIGRTQQDRIVTTIDQQLSVLDDVERIVFDGVQRSRSLRSAVLAEAFSGRLVSSESATV